MNQVSKANRISGRRILGIAGLILLVMLILTPFAWLRVFDKANDAAIAVSRLSTRAEVRAELRAFREVPFPSGSGPAGGRIWHRRDGRNPRGVGVQDLKVCAYRFWGLPVEVATVYVAYDKDDKIAATREYD